MLHLAYYRGSMQAGDDDALQAEAELMSKADSRAVVHNGASAEFAHFSAPASAATTAAMVEASRRPSWTANEKYM